MAPPSRNERDGGTTGARRRSTRGSEPSIVFGPTAPGVTPTRERDKGQGAGLRSRAFLLSAIGVNRTREENADARQTKNSFFIKPAIGQLDAQFLGDVDHVLNACFVALVGKQNSTMDLR